MTNLMIEKLKMRRSVKSVDMFAPAPSKAELQEILTIAARVPDHGRRVPFHFMVFEGGTRALVGEKIAEIDAKENPMATEKKMEIEENRFSRAPLVVAVIYRKRQGKHPLWEQMLTAGAVCQNMLLAADAYGYAGQWLSEWYAYNEEFRTFLGLDERDVVAGFMHIGTPPLEKPEERERPDLNKIVTYWHPNQPINNGDDVYDTDKFPIPPLGLS